MQPNTTVTTVVNRTHTFTIDLTKLQSILCDLLNDRVVSIHIALDEVTIHVAAVHYLDVMVNLKTAPLCQFEQLIDLCGVDYVTHGKTGGDAEEEQEEALFSQEKSNNPLRGARYAVVCHLLSVSLNQRVRVVVVAKDNAMPIVPSLVELWSAANWFEREAFDLFGIAFEGHPDLRRILTDYGFIGHPFRKDFPTHGHVEMRYDPVQKRVVYEPVGIELREITPRTIREENYGRN